MNKAIRHFRGNVVAYLALFVALGGTGYAAISVPAGSVGTRQLRNGAVTAGKLNSRSIAGSVVFWAKIAQSGHVTNSSEPATVSNWNTGVGEIAFRGQVSSRCFALANGIEGANFGYVMPSAAASSGGLDHLGVMMLPPGSNSPTPTAVAVAVVCPG